MECLTHPPLTNHRFPPSYNSIVRNDIPTLRSLLKSCVFAAAARIAAWRTGCPVICCHFFGCRIFRWIRKYACNSLGFLLRVRRLFNTLLHSRQRGPVDEVLVINARSFSKQSFFCSNFRRWKMFLNNFRLDHIRTWRKDASGLRGRRIRSNLEAPGNISRDQTITTSVNGAKSVLFFIESQSLSKKQTGLIVSLKNVSRPWIDN